jgi:tripartite-type tricarboxylate transporter receptor subunit TctC
MRDSGFFGAALLVIACAGGPAADAQTYPTRPITMVVPFAAGGPTDTITRIVAERMRSSLGQTVIIENVTGADGSIGVGRVARAAPDGYTLSIGQWSTHVLNGAAYTLAYDLLKDFEPVALLATNPEVIVTNTAVPAKDLAELIAWLKPNQGNVSVGMASMSHRVAAVYFQNRTGARFVFVPYRGAGPAMQDLLAGNVDMMFDAMGTSATQIRSGKLRGLAVATPQRMTEFPDIPTSAEIGVPRWIVSTWYGLWAIKGTPAPIVERMYAEVARALAVARLQEIWKDKAAEAGGETPVRFAQRIRGEIEKWEKVVATVEVRID